MAETPKKENGDSEDEDRVDDDEKQDGNSDTENGRGKRKRRESKIYEPDDFTMASHYAAMKNATVVEGRGKKLGEIAAVKANIESFKLNSDEFLSAFKFVFSSRGIPNKNAMRKKLLDFSGYLPSLPQRKYNKQRQEEEDEVIETKYATKAFKMNVTRIKTLCSFFSVDHSDGDGKTLKKDDLIDRLLDFLGAPDEAFVKKREPVATKKALAAKTQKIKTKPRTVVRKIKEDPFSLIKDYKKGEFPSDDAMRQWVKAYIVCVDMETATTKDAVLTASAKFGVEMVSKKARIKQLLAEEI